MKKTFIVLAAVSPVMWTSIAESAPREQTQQSQIKKKKYKVSQKTAVKRCDMSVQDRYAHYVRYCKLIKRETIARTQVPAVPAITEVSNHDSDSAAAFFAADRARMQNVQVVYNTNQTIKNKLAKSVPAKKERPFNTPDPIRVAKQWEGYHAQRNRSELRNLLTEGNGSAIDPVKIPWCAAFANAILKQTGREGTGSLQARSFLGYGIATKYPKEGDIVVFSRGRNRSAGHVGFYKGEETIEGVKYILVFGGNQNKEVNLTHYPASKLLGYRKLG
jgi:uncharacterized protein (TIGR02594 family)